MSYEELPVLENQVEVDIKTAGLNFKDVEVTMGIVPENEYLLGLEGSGVMCRVSIGASKFRVGDQIAFLTFFEREHSRTGSNVQLSALVLSHAT